MYFCLSIERTAEKLRYLRLSSSIRKQRSKRNSQASTPNNHLQSPVINEARNSTSSTSNTTGRKRHQYDYFSIKKKKNVFHPKVVI